MAAFYLSTEKIDDVLDDAQNTERMVNQILCRTFTSQKGHDKALLPTYSEVIVPFDLIN